ncbi:hypothetical protein GCM10022278_07250 [Allohahella marinimesophila]|uniref:Uncharacterized protein n=1 Tax=Allohahella marinimesophila TaxID=1054972 RepID=A0ABP7NN28_9GAMM
MALQTDMSVRQTAILERRQLTAGPPARPQCFMQGIQVLRSYCDI